MKTRREEDAKRHTDGTTDPGRVGRTKRSNGRGKSRGSSATPFATPQKGVLSNAIFEGQHDDFGEILGAVQSGRDPNRTKLAQFKGPLLSFTPAACAASVIIAGVSILRFHGPGGVRLTTRRGPGILDGVNALGSWPIERLRVGSHAMIGVVCNQHSMAGRWGAMLACVRPG